MRVSDKTINSEIDFRRAQVYGFLSEAFLYPEENWTVDVPFIQDASSDLNGVKPTLDIEPLELAELQRAHRLAFGLTGPLCYETEFGLPHEFRVSQELADLSGFYRAFGFTLGGAVRERPDHVAVELEFMHVLALKGCLAATKGDAAHTEACLEAQRMFLGDHLGRWIDPFAKIIAEHAGGSPYICLSRFAAGFIQADTERLGVAAGGLEGSRPTPFDPSFSCEGCPVDPR
jgi:nitrate reductase assembly molybdenum cofactor insertion protein NarJ